MKKIIENLIFRIPFTLRKLLLGKLENSFTNMELLRVGKNSTYLSLQRLLTFGFNPTCIIDVGAHNGEWTIAVNKIFPTASLIAVEALPEKREVLEKAFGNLKVKIYNCLLGDSNKKNIPFYSMETGSSVLKELTNFSRAIIHLDMITLDEICEDEKLKENILLKLDVQGFEREILKGAQAILDRIEIICMEVSFLNYNEGAPLADEVIPFMKDLGFVIYDITGFMRKSNDYALVQSDIIFIKHDNPIRQQINDLKEVNFNIIQY